MQAKRNMNLTELVKELEAEKIAKRDYVAPSSSLKMIVKETSVEDFSTPEPQIITRKTPLLVVPESKNGVEGGMYVPNEIFHQHMAAKLDIPARYYRRMLNEAPELLAKNTNEWLSRSETSSLVRTFEWSDEKIARALLSDRYGIMDNYDILFAALTAIKESGVKVDIRECNVTDKKLYIYITAPDVEVDGTNALRGYLRDNASVGYGIISGLAITNSEVGYGSYNIAARALIKVCRNGMVADTDFRKVHLGARLNEGQVQWSKNTQQKNLELIKSQTADAVKTYLSQDFLSGMVRKLEVARGVALENPVDALQNAVKEISKAVTISEESKKNILNFFVADGDTSAAGIAHAVTREAQNLGADEQYDLEKLAFEFLPKMKEFDKPFVGKN